MTRAQTQLPENQGPRVFGFSAKRPFWGQLSLVRWRMAALRNKAAATPRLLVNADAMGFGRISAQPKGIPCRENFAYTAVATATYYAQDHQTGERTKGENYEPKLLI